MKILFEWDPVKGKLNIKKHKVSFDEAKSVFWDENAIDIFDPDHSENEERFLMLGISNQFRLLIVSYQHKTNGNQIIRIISARKATKNEAKAYTGG